jgi:hypothetical protein
MLDNQTYLRRYFWWQLAVDPSRPKRPQMLLRI